ncbi:MAG: UDP-N-acetylmuramoyl-tripeptide--D-alanyl-D-alanine ligase [Mogibacterium sp.]|nr:UDP-N-acetylmuramoyl-tripeptide--D-alanyl-D-alanine ligase [Mogibacterium sp.]
MIILTLITLVLAVPAYWLTLRYNMHMFQLNGYKDKEQFDWIKKNFHMQWILVFSMVWGFASMLVMGLSQSRVLWGICCAVIWLTLAVIIIVYRLLREMNSKKPLVFTPRVKRMVACIIIIALLMLLIPYFAGRIKSGAIVNFGPFSGFLLWLVGSQIFMNISANDINSPIENGINKHYINDAKRILAENPDLTIIGVTGSYGKTSVKFYLESLLRAKYSVLVTPESYNTPMGVVKTIRGSLRRTHEIFVCEMGARYVGEIKELCDLVHPKHGIIASIGPQHLDTFESIANIQMTKFELGDSIPEGGMLFLNGDNEYINEHLDYLKKSGADLPPAYKEPVMYHAGGSDRGYYASDIELTAHGTRFTAHSPDGESCTYDMKLVGGHNIINVMGAIAVAHEMGIALKDLRIPVRRLKSVPHRMEMKNHGAVTIIDDAFNSNPIGSKAAVETLAMFDGMRILITPGMVELGEEEAEYNRKFGTYAASCCDYILLVGGKHTDPIREGALSEGFPEKKCMRFDRVEEAIDYAYGIKTRNDEHKYILLENDLPDNYQ